MHTKQTTARNLYFQTELTQAEIAKLCEVSDRTISRWINEGYWKTIKVSARQTPAMIVEQFYTQLSAMNYTISQREERPYPTKEEAVIMRNLTLNIKSTKQGHTQSDYIQMMMHFIDQVQTENPELAQQITHHADKLISGKMQRGHNPWQIEYQSETERRQEPKNQQTQATQHFPSREGSGVCPTQHEQNQTETSQEPDTTYQHSQPQPNENQEVTQETNVNNATPQPDITEEIEEERPRNSRYHFTVTKGRHYHLGTHWTAQQFDDYWGINDRLTTNE